MRATTPPTAVRSKTLSAGSIRKTAGWIASAPRSGTGQVSWPRPAAATRWRLEQTPPEAVNLVADGVYDRGKTEDLGAQGINGLTWGLLMLDSRGYAVPAGAADTRETILTRILSAQSAERGFSLGGEGVSADLTAMTLQALAPYQNSTHVFTVTDKATGTTVERTVSEAIELALGALSACQMENGGFGDDGESSESAAQVIIALCALGIDPATDARFVKRGGSVLDALLRFAKPDGGFAHTLEKGADGSNAMAGEQALGALTAYMRFKDGLHSLYDLRGEADAETAEAVRALREEIDALAAAGTEPDAATAAELQARYDAIPAGERRYVFNYTYLLRWERALGMDIEEPFYDPAEEVPAAEKLDVRTAGTAWSTRFTAADAAVCAALPSPATLADADTVALLLDKLGDTDSAWRTALLEKETEIAAQLAGGRGHQRPHRRRAVPRQKSSARATAQRSKRSSRDIEAAAGGEPGVRHRCGRALCRERAAGPYADGPDGWNYRGGRRGDCCRSRSHYHKKKKASIPYRRDTKGDREMNQIIGEIRREVGKVILGKDDAIAKVLMAMLSGGHVLLEDVPGTGKTTLALSFSKALGLDYKRIQFTSDTVPSDVIGFSLYNKESKEFEYVKGAVMCNLLLADEINRTSSKTQSALLEVMEEGHVTVDGRAHDVPQPFHRYRHAEPGRLGGERAAAAGWHSSTAS